MPKAGIPEHYGAQTRITSRPCGTAGHRRTHGAIEQIDPNPTSRASMATWGLISGTEKSFER